MKLLYLILFLPLLIFSQTITLPWSSTYNCSEWTQSDGEPVGCDNFNMFGGWTTINGAEEQITSAANMAAGDGGRGQRHWEGDGTNNNSGGLRLTFASTQNELWFRWYMRYQSGFAWSPYLNYDKHIYIWSTGANEVIPEWQGADNYNIASQNPSANYSASGCGWTTTMGGSTSDGLWHCFEIHIKMDTNGSNGVGEIWIDDDLKYSQSNLDFNTETGWTYLAVGSNQRYVSNGSDYAVDFDDIAISNTGRIGPLSGTAPSSPQNLRIVREFVKLKE